MTSHCPTPHPPGAQVLLAHGSGGVLSHQLVTRALAPHLANQWLDQMDDAARLPTLAGPPVISTDGFIVNPWRFPGGDIGALAVSGAVNDVAMAGGRPRYLTLGVVVEEGFALADLEAVMASLGRAAREADVCVVAGDTKVTPRGQGGGVFLTVTCVGEAVDRREAYPQPPQPGDVLLVSGPLARHGVAVAAARQGGLPPDWAQSDAACLHHSALALHQHLATLRLMRDPTRGGFSAVLHEWAQAWPTGFEVDEEALPLREEESAFCKALGLEPLHLASEGVLMAVVGQDEAAQALGLLRAHPLTAQAVAVGEVTGEKGEVVLRTALGTQRYLDAPVGEIVSRIC